MTREWIVAQSQDEKTYTENADEPQGEADPSVSLDSVGEASVGRHNIAYDEVDRVPEKIGPASLSFEKPAESDERQGRRYHEEEYPASAVTPSGEPRDPALSPS